MVFPLPVLPAVNRTSAFQGVIDVPLFDPGYRLPTPPFTTVTPWRFVDKSTHPVIAAVQNTTGGVGFKSFNNAVAAFTLTPFNVTSARRPSAATLPSGSYNTTSLGFWNTLFTFTQSIFPGNNDWYLNYLQAIVGVNTFYPGPLQEILMSTNSGRSGATVFQSGFTFVHNAAGAIGLTPAFCIVSLDSPDVWVSGVDYQLFGRFEEAVFSLTFVGGFNPRWNVMDFSRDFNHMAMQLASPTRPLIASFGTSNASYSVPGNVASLKTILFDISEFNTIFNGAGWDFRSGFSRGHILRANNVSNSLTPGQPSTIVVLNPDGSKYWVVKFVPKTTFAASMLAGAEWQVMIDPGGIFYFNSDTDKTVVLNSFGLSFTLNWPSASLGSIRLPCWGNCASVPLDRNRL